MKKGKNFVTYLYQRILLLFLLFVFVSVIFNTFTYLREKNYYYEIIEGEQQDRINYLSKNINEEFTKLKITANMMAGDNQVLELYCKWDVSDSFEKNEMSERIQNSIMELNNLNSFVSDSSLFFPDKGVKIDKDGISFDNSNTDLYTEMYLKNKIVSVENGKIYIIEVYPKNYLEKIEKKEDILSIFVIELSTNQLRQEMQFAKMVDKDILFLLTLEEDRICSATVNNGITQDKIQKNTDSMKINGEEYHVMKSHNNGQFFYLYYLQDQKFLHLIRHKMISNILLFTVIILSVILVVLFLFFQKILHPLEILLVDAFDQIRQSNFSYRIPMPGKEDVFRNLYENFNYMAERLDTLVSKELKQEILINQANFKHLQAQINPHFMYNSYFLLYRLIKKRDIEGSLIVCENLGKFFQYITRDSGDSKSLEEEIRHARSYAVIQGFRFRNRIQIKFPELPEQYWYVETPRLIIQPLIENVFKYVVSDLGEDDEVVLEISYEEDEENLMVTVENSGIISDETLEEIRGKIKNSKENDEITALVNINKRLNLFFRREQSIDIGRSRLGGLKVILYLKL